MSNARVRRAVQDRGMPRRATPLPDPLRSGTFSTREAAQAGVGRGRLRHGDIVHPHHGLYASGEKTADFYDRCLLAVPLLGPSRWFSHVTAARLWGIPLPFAWVESEPLHVIALPGAEPIVRPGIVGWESARHPGGAIMAGVPVVGAAGTWAQLSVPGATGRYADSDRRRALDVDWLIAAGDYLLTGPRRLGGRVPLCTLEDLAAVVRGHRGRRGAKSLASALPSIRRGPQSPRETLLRLALVRHGLPEPVVQPEILTAEGVRHPDLGYLEERVLVEYHGDGHRTSRAQWLEDLRRRQLFDDAGYRVFEVAAGEFDDGCRALAQRLTRALRAAV